MRHQQPASTDRDPISVPWEVATTPQTTVQQEVVAPLSSDQIEGLDQTARRLHAELRGVVALLPPDSRSASGMARFLGIDRTSCQRLVSGVSGPYAGPGLLTKLPGVRGLVQWLAACRSCGLDGALLDPAAAAIERFSDAIQSVGGSQSKLARRLSAGQSAAAGGSSGASKADEDLLRKHLFEAGRAVTGQHTDVSIATFVFRETPGSEDLIDSGQLRCFLGHHMRASAMPFSFMWWGHALEIGRAHV